MMSFLVGAIETLFLRVSTTFVGFCLVVWGRRRQRQFGTFGSSKFAGDRVEVRLSGHVREAWRGVLAGSDGASDRSHDRRRDESGCTCSFRLQLASCQGLGTARAVLYLLYD